ncbi:hypothetical protein M446_6730 [Methylobacterium sp. 4-46]|uniref:hypothetical protein n=1 Tax=unclassified Methylobacterium TaxID=2615210 RepID=UPI000165CD07|nr:MULTISPECIES: hypothetical protein [Methylobacterium]ACA20980.1 hypothetical protein M446_6730 [Methylobacterium sp. 4-46]WFT80135.1 hypothetical protein QA634_33990 [Methylobacterium nodulans]
MPRKARAILPKSSTAHSALSNCMLPRELHGRYAVARRLHYLVATAEGERGGSDFLDFATQHKTAFERTAIVFLDGGEPGVKLRKVEA